MRMSGSSCSSSTPPAAAGRRHTAGWMLPALVRGMESACVCSTESPCFGVTMQETTTHFFCSVAQGRSQWAAVHDPQTLMMRQPTMGRRDPQSLLQ